jgi:hypothetical protein
MEVCGWCGVLALGGECTNLHCKPARENRAKAQVKRQQKTKSTKPKSKRKLSGEFNRYIQSNGAVLVPGNIHLQREDSLPKFFGYATGKKSKQELRRAALLKLFEAELQTSPGAPNISSIGEFGPASSEKRKEKILSWFEGRIDRSRLPKLAASRAKLIEDRDYVSLNF